MKSRGLIFGSERVATPAEVSFTNNKIWSNNAGRTANCKMVGDIRAIKKTVTLKWYHLTGEETAKLNEYISNVDSPFFSITLLDETFQESTFDVYAGDPTYEVFGWDEKRQFCKGVAVDLIMQQEADICIQQVQPSPHASKATAAHGVCGLKTTRA